MVAHCSFIHSSTAFTICMPFCTRNGSRLLILALDNGFRDSLRTDFFSGWPCVARSSAHQRLSLFGTRLLNGWQQIPHSSPRQRLSLLGRCFPHRMIAHCLYFCSPMAFTACAPCFPTDGSGLLVLLLINSFHDGLRAVLLCGW